MDPGFVVLLAVALTIFVMVTGILIAGCVRGDLGVSINSDF